MRKTRVKGLGTNDGEPEELEFEDCNEGKEEP